MKLFRKLLPGFISVFRVVTTARSSLQLRVWSTLHSVAANSSALAYFGFLTFSCWLAREHVAAVKLLWFAPIKAGGNIAMSLYVLPQLFGLRGDQPASALFPQKVA